MRQTPLTEGYFLVTGAAGARRDRGGHGEERGGVQRNSGPDHFAGSDDTHKLASGPTERGSSSKQGWVVRAADVHRARPAAVRATRRSDRETSKSSRKV